MTTKAIGLSAAIMLLASIHCIAHEIYFCGERIPVASNLVSGKLMDVIRKQIPYVNLPQLRKRADANFPVVEDYLQNTGLPDDFKYLAIVESGFQNVTSVAGARGFWQLMPNTARGLGLTVSAHVDERDNIHKSTYAACQVLASYYLDLRRKYGISSWVLTAAAYNLGITRMRSTIDKQGTDYFSMNLNPETALYVYKIIAVKELFEYPELYMKDFGYNVFRVIQENASTGLNANADVTAFTSMTVEVDTKDGRHPDNVVVKEQSGQVIIKEQSYFDATKFKYLAANISGKYRRFKDGSLITIELMENMEVLGTFNRKGSRLKGKGWIIGDRVFIDLGYGTRDVALLDLNGKKGIPLSSLKKNDSVVLLKIKK